MVRVACLPLIAACLWGGCKTPLEKALGDVTDHYRVRRPASAEPELGRRIVGSRAVKNRCYLGTKREKLIRSWDEVRVVYSGASGAEVRADFGDALTVEAGGKIDVQTDVLLRGNAVKTIDDVYFMPAGVCAQSDRERYTRDGGAVDEVVVRELYATKLEVVSREGGSARVSVDLDKLPGEVPVGLGGGARVASVHAQRWEGEGLYYGRQTFRYRTKMSDIRAPGVRVGSGAVTLGSCSLTLTGYDPGGAWTGKIGCQNGSSYSIKGDGPSAWPSVNTSRGVSYGARVERGAGDAPGHASVHVVKTTTVEVP